MLKLEEFDRAPWLRQVMYSVVHQGLRPEIPAGCPLQFRALMERCWQADAAHRPPFEEITASLATMVKDNAAVVAVAANAANAAKAAHPPTPPQLHSPPPVKAPLVAPSTHSFSFLRPFGGPREKHTVQKGAVSMTYRRSQSAFFERPALAQNHQVPPETRSLFIHLGLASLFCSLFRPTWCV